MKQVLGRKDNVLMLNNATKTIQQTVVIDVMITCPMTFTRFPFDTQSCTMEFLQAEKSVRLIPEETLFLLESSSLDLTLGRGFYRVNHVK